MRRALSGCVVACALLGGRPAGAASALVGGASPTELRVAYAETGQWTTVWASFRLDGGAGPVGMVVPLPDGAFVDLSSDAWFEALEVATAPRVWPPTGLSPVCPGVTGTADPFEITASTAHTESLLPVSIVALDGAPGVLDWAAAEGLSVDDALADALAATGAAKLLGVRFNASGGAASTPTLRVTAPKGLATLPFSITRAGAGDVRVTAWLFGEGRAGFTGTTAASVPGSAIAWNAKSGKSSYVEYMDDLLAGDPDLDVLESAGHDALSDGSVAGAVSIEGVAPVYFARASAYGNALPGAGACIDAAKAALASGLVVGPACPRGDLAALAGACPAEAPGPGELDPAALLCGPGADDLALVLSGAVPAATWVTRHTFVIAAGAAGKDRAVLAQAGPEKVPVLTAASVDIGDCFGGTGGGSSSSSSGSGGASGTSSTGSGSGGTSTGSGTGNSGQGSSGSGNPGGFGGFGGYAGEDSGSDIYIDTSGCACSPGVVDTYDSSGSSPDSAGGEDCDSGSSSSGSGEDCDSGSSSSSSGSGDDCDSGSSSSASGDDCDSGSSPDPDFESGDSWESTGDPDPGDTMGANRDPADTAAGHCSVGQARSKARRRAGPRLSVMMLGLVGLLFPLRRRGTRRRREEE